MVTIQPLKCPADDSRSHHLTRTVDSDIRNCIALALHPPFDMQHYTYPIITPHQPTDVGGTCHEAVSKISC